GVIVLADEQTTIEGNVDARGVDTAGLTLARLTANARLINGVGQVRAQFAGRRGANFDFSTLADVSPDKIRLTGNGHIGRQPLVLNQPAVLTRAGDGWALSPTSVSFAGGAATVSGRSGSAPEVHAQVAAMPLEVLDIFWPNLDLSGSTSASRPSSTATRRRCARSRRATARSSAAPRPGSPRWATVRSRPSF